MTGTIRLAALGLSLTAAGAFGYLQRGGQAAPPGEDPVALGRAVYVSEGCLHCHSQYVRPVGLDTELWGPPTDPDQALAQRPVLIGNRRQGPDLANVGLRRDRTWNRLHLENPGSVSPGSRMPSYAHLFRAGDTRGEALLSYLEALQPDTAEGKPLSSDSP